MRHNVFKKGNWGICKNYRCRRLLNCVHKIYSIGIRKPYQISCRSNINWPRTKNTNLFCSTILKPFLYITCQMAMETVHHLTYFSVLKEHLNNTCTHFAQLVFHSPLSWRLTVHWLAPVILTLWKCFSFIYNKWWKF